MDIICNKPATGWLVWKVYPGEVWRLVAHSVVNDERGALFDITPARDADRKGMGFIRHIGTDAQFSAIRQRWPEVLYPTYFEADLHTSSVETDPLDLNFEDGHNAEEDL